MKVQFLRVIGIRTTAFQPSVLALVDGDVRVKWQRAGWACDCDDWQIGDDGDTCPHVDAVAALLAPQVTGESA